MLCTIFILSQNFWSIVNLLFTICNLPTCRVLGLLLQFLQLLWQDFQLVFRLALNNVELQQTSIVQSLFALQISFTAPSGHCKIPAETKFKAVILTISWIQHWMKKQVMHIKLSNGVATDSSYPLKPPLREKGGICPHKKEGEGVEGSMPPISLKSQVVGSTRHSFFLDLKGTFVKRR